MNNTSTHLDQLRQEIDALDRKLILMLVKRMKLASAVGKYKIQHHLQPLDKQRWQTVLHSRITLGKETGLPSTFVRSVFNLIHHHSLLIQRNLKP